MTEIPPLPPGAARDPPPGLPQAPIVSLSELKVGDVVQVATMFDDDGRTRWWKRFMVVLEIGPAWRPDFEAINLKMRPNTDRQDFKTCDIKDVGLAQDWKGRPQVVTKLQEPWPQGVAAMYMKLLAQRIIKIGDE